MVEVEPRTVRQAGTDGIDTAWLFSRLNPQEHEELFRRARYFDCEAGQPIFQSGMPSERLYLVCTGKVKLVQQTSDKQKEFILKILGPGELLGEETFFADDRFNVYARALEPTQLCVFSREDFLSFLDRHPEATLRLLEATARELRAFQDRLVASVYERGERRLAQLLLDLCRKYGACLEGDAYVLGLKLSRAELAELVGLRPETTIRIMSRWRDKGLLGEREGQLIIRDRTGLQAHL